MRHLLAGNGHAERLQHGLCHVVERSIRAENARGDAGDHDDIRSLLLAKVRNFQLGKVVRAKGMHVQHTLLFGWLGVRNRFSA